MLLKDLQTLGFSKNTAKVYLALVSLGVAKGGELVQKTGLHCNLVYTSLQTLEKKKVVTRLNQRGVAVYKALDPHCLVEDFRTKEQFVESVVERLKSTYKPLRQQIRVYEGVDEVRRVEIEIFTRLEKQSLMRYLGVSRFWVDVMGEDGLSIVTQLQQKKNIQIRAVGNYAAPDFVSRTPGLTQVKVLPNIVSDESETVILNDRIYIKTLVAPYTVIEIINSDIAKNYRDHFDVIWSQDIFTYTGWSAVRSMLDEVVSNLSTSDTEYVIGVGYGTKSIYDKVHNVMSSYHSMIAQKEIPQRILVLGQYRELFEVEMSEVGVGRKQQVSVRYLSDAYASPMEIHVYPTYVVMVLWQEEPRAVVYKNQMVVDGYRKQFQYLWEQAQKGEYTESI